MQADKLPTQLIAHGGLQRRASHLSSENVICRVSCRVRFLTRQFRLPMAFVTCFVSGLSTIGKLYLDLHLSVIPFEAALVGSKQKVQEAPANVSGVFGSVRNTMSTPPQNLHTTDLYVQQKSALRGSSDFTCAASAPRPARKNSS